MGGMAITLVVLAMLMLAPAPKALSQQGGGGRLDGTWDVQLTVRNCQTGAIVRTFPEINTFIFGGTMINSTSGVPPTTKTPGQGVWSHVSGNTYQFSFKFFNFDGAGFLSGWTTISQEATLNADGTEYTSEGTVEAFNASGVSVFKGCSTTTATRFE